MLSKNNDRDDDDDDLDLNFAVWYLDLVANSVLEGSGELDSFAVNCGDDDTPLDVREAVSYRAVVRCHFEGAYDCASLVVPNNSMAIIPADTNCIDLDE